MTERNEQIPFEENDSDLMDTQRLLLGAQALEGKGYDLDAILAEYGSSAQARPPAPPERPREAQAAAPPEGPPPEPAAPPELAAPPEEPPEEASEPEEEAPGEPGRLEELEELEGQDLSGFIGEQWMDGALTGSAGEGSPEEEESSVTMEDIVASTVDAVKGDQEKAREKWRSRLEKARRKQAARRREPSARQGLPPIQDEPSAQDTAAWHRRRYFACRRSLLLSAAVVLALWAPWALERLGRAVPFFSASADNAALCVLLPQALACALAWPVFRAALEGLRERSVTLPGVAALANLVTMLDEITLLLLPNRLEAPPLGGVAAVSAVFALWGLKGYHRGMWESFRTAALGQPGWAVDVCEQGAVKGRGSLAGFYTRAAVEDTASQWQRLLLPVLTAASLVFALLSSAGQARGQDFLWCWSVTLCAAAGLDLPLAFSVPFWRLAARLARGGAAVAGHYGAAVLASTRQVVAVDGDFFPQSSAGLAGIKLFGEERGRALSYAAGLATLGGGLMGRVFGDAAAREHISPQGVDSFHIHDGGGLGGIIHGETVLLGPPVFMRRQAVKLPANMPAKTCVCLSVDGELTAVFSIRYAAAEPVEAALRSAARGGLRLRLATRDGNITPKLLRARFGTDAGAEVLELEERLALSDPNREGCEPNGILYREGIIHFVELAAGSRRLCQTVRTGNLLSILGSVCGVLLGFYLTFVGSFAVLTPVNLLTYLFLWAAPMLPLVWSADKL